MHGFKPRFHHGPMRELSANAGEWTSSEESRTAAWVRIFQKQTMIKKRYNSGWHENFHYKPGEIVVMTSPPVHNGESTKLQKKYRGPMVIKEMLPGDVYRVVQLAADENKQYATTTHVTQLK